MKITTNNKLADKFPCMEITRGVVLGVTSTGIELGVFNSNVRIVGQKYHSQIEVLFGEQTKLIWEMIAQNFPVDCHVNAEAVIVDGKVHLVSIEHC